MQFDVKQSQGRIPHGIAYFGCTRRDKPVRGKHQ